MDPFNTAPDFILDLIFLKLNEEDLHETLRVSKSWFRASIRRTKKLKITWRDNPLKSMTEFYNKQRSPCEDELDWLELFGHLVLYELVVIWDDKTTNYLVNNGCNTAELTIQTSGEEEVPVTLASLRAFTRLQSFEFLNNWEMKWHPFIIECLKSSDCEFDPNIECPIDAIKLNSSAWNAEDPVLMLVTKLSLSKVTIDFLRTLVDLCPNLKALHCTDGVITQDWHQVFPANIKRIELDDMKLTRNVARVVNASTDAGRQLLPYLCQNWESVEKFHFYRYIDVGDATVYEAFPQEREELLMCQRFNEAVNLGSPLFQSREICVECNGRKALRLKIPPTKCVTFEFLVERDFKFSPRDVCLEPGKVEDLALLLKSLESLVTFEPFGPNTEFTLEPFEPNSFEGFSRLTSLTLSRVNALSIKMALDQCPSIKKLKLNELKAFTISRMSRGSSYANVNELLLEECEETMHSVFQMFPCLSKFQQSLGRGDEIAADWLWRHLIEVDKKYGVSFDNTIGNWYMVSDDLQASLNEAQKLLKEDIILYETVCYLKGFKLIPRVWTQKVIYIN